jgi:hypothetical protein
VAQQRSPARYPTGGDYVDALQHPRLAFNDPQLKDGQVKADDLGMPEPVSGNFASVFQVAGADGDRWAVKCFVRPDQDRHRRYGAITTALQALRHPALVDFDYLDEGVMVAGVRYPLLKMRWVQAQSLMPWLEANLSHPDRLRAVADQFAEVVRALERAGIAHGDLQHGNLLITDSGELKLIDYDGMYVPEIAGLPPNEKGLVNYQHPQRADRDYGPGLDRFSAWVIYTSLVAVAARPELWRRLRTSDDDTKLLFAAADYLDPAGSAALRELRTAGPAHLAVLADRLAEFARLAPAQIPALEAVPAGVAVQPAPAVQAEIPDWLADHLRIHGSAAPSPATTAAPAGPTAVSFAGPHLVIARIATAWIALAAAGGEAATLGVAALTVVPAILWFLAVAAGAAVIAGAYRSHPLLAARRAAAGDLARAKAEVATAEGEVRQVQHLVAQLGAERTVLHQSIARQRAEAVRQRGSATTQAQQVLQQSLQAIDQRRSDWNNTRQAWEQRRLAEIVDQHVRRALAAAVIAKDPPRMVDAKLAAALAGNGFRTAADFVGYHTSNGYGRYPRTFIRRDHNDYGTYVENVGEKRAQSLSQWREGIKSRAESRAPKSLDPQQHQEVTTRFEQFRAELDDQETQAKGQARSASELANTIERDAQAALDQQQRRSETDLTVRQANLDRRSTGAQKTVADAQRKAAHLSDAFAPLARITVPNYLLAAVAGNRS